MFLQRWCQGHLEGHHERQRHQVRAARLLHPEGHPEPVRGDRRPGRHLRRCKELGGKVVVSSGTEDTAAAQIPSIQAAIQAHADAIVIAGNDPSALCPALGQAPAAGIKVVSFDSDVTCPNHLFINQADTEQIGTSEVDLLAKADQQHR